MHVLLFYLLALWIDWLNLVYGIANFLYYLPILLKASVIIIHLPFIAKLLQTVHTYSMSLNEMNLNGKNDLFFTKL